MKALIQTEAICMIALTLYGTRYRHTSSLPCKYWLKLEDFTLNAYTTVTSRVKWVYV